VAALLKGRQLAQLPRPDRPISLCVQAGWGLCYQQFPHRL